MEAALRGEGGTPTAQIGRGCRGKRFTKLQPGFLQALEEGEALPLAKNALKTPTNRSRGACSRESRSIRSDRKEGQNPTEADAFEIGDGLRAADRREGALIDYLNKLRIPAPGAALDGTAHIASLLHRDG